MHIHDLAAISRHGPAATPIHAPAAKIEKMVGARLAALILIAALSAGCESKSSKTGAAGIGKAKTVSGCVEQPGSTAIALAVRDFIKHSEPKPMRFLTAAGTDSAIPDEGIRELQDKGPTYFYAGADAARKKVREKLELAGPFTALLVVMRGDRKNEDGTEVVSLGGHYVTGQFDGKAAASHAYTMSCDTAGWRIKTKADQ